MCLLRWVAMLFVWCLAAAQDSGEGSDEAILVPIIRLLDDDSAVMGKRALNPFTDSVGKRFIHPPMMNYASSPRLAAFGRAPHHKSIKNGQLEMFSNNKRQFFDSLAGQTLGMRRYLDTLAVAKALEKRSASKPSSSLVWLPV